MIAIVDDYKAVRNGLESILRSLGYRTSTFGSAEEFLKSGKLQDTSCLITDVQMPGLTGIDLQDRLNAQGYRIPIIFITAHPDENVRARAMKAGAVGFLSKPFKDNHLLACLETALKATKAAATDQGMTSLP